MTTRNTETEVDALEYATCWDDREFINNDFNEWWYALPDEAPSNPIELARMAFFAGIAYANRVDEQQDES
jgi:hypothetical protein